LQRDCDRKKKKPACSEAEGCVCSYVVIIYLIMTPFTIFLLKTIDRIGPILFIATTVGIFLHSRTADKRLDEILKKQYNEWYRKATDAELRSHLMHPFGKFINK